MRLLVLRAVAAAAFACWPPPAVAVEDKVILVNSEDAEMNEAMAKARATIAEFWRQFEKPGAGVEDFALKVRIKDENGTEFFWLIDIERGSGRHSGKIDNDPGIVKNVTIGQRYEFTDDEIVDWSFMRNGKMVGNETMRALMKYVSAEDAARYREMLEQP